MEKCSKGIITAINCIIIDEVIYGPIPKANIETLPKAPPENKSRNPKILFWLAKLAKCSLSIPNNGI